MSKQNYYSPEIQKLEKEVDELIRSLNKRNFVYVMKFSDNNMSLISDDDELLFVF